jgi:hypothetical protein
MSGINLLDAGARNARDTIYGECFTHNSQDLHRPAASLRWRWMIQGDWKLIVPASQNEPDGLIELYQLSMDATEEKNLAPAEAARVTAMRTRLDAWWPGQ